MNGRTAKLIKKNVTMKQGGKVSKHMIINPIKEYKRFWNDTPHNQRKALRVQLEIEIAEMNEKRREQKEGIRNIV